VAAVGQTGRARDFRFRHEVPRDRSWRLKIMQARSKSAAARSRAGLVCRSWLTSFSVP
jgi:hypothetical protein